MRNFARLAAVGLLLACVVLASVGADEVAEPAPGYWTLERVAEGVWAALQPHERRFNDCNVVIIEGTDDLVVVDAPANADTVRELAAELGRLSPKPVRFVINTHWHGDHTQGNAIYRELWGANVSFIGHESLREDVPGRAEVALRERVDGLQQRISAAEQQLEQGSDEDGRPISADERVAQGAAIERANAWLERNRAAEFLVPDVTYADAMVLQRGTRRIELHHFRAHTRGDTVVYLPAEGVLISGDLLDDLPYVGHGHPTDWLATLRTLSEYKFEIVIPGHGPVFRGRDQLQRVTGFIAELVSKVGAAVAAGQSLAQAQQLEFANSRASLARDDGARRFFDQTLAEAIERAFEEASATD